MTSLKTTWNALSSTIVSISLTIATGCVPPRPQPIQGDVSIALSIGILEGNEIFNHTLWDEILSSYARQNGEAFDYVGLKFEEGKLDHYLYSVAEIDLRRLASAEIKALFINAYNAYTVKGILDNVRNDGSISIRSIRDISRIWSRAENKIGGYLLSLDNMEHNVLRAIFKDPRIHFALNCASLSCPAIFPTAFTGTTLDEQLDSATRAALSSAKHVKIDGDVLLLSKLFDWYGVDFLTSENLGAEKHLADYVAKYTRADVRQWLSRLNTKPEIRFLKYNWELNKI